MTLDQMKHAASGAVLTDYKPKLASIKDEEATDTDAKAADAKKAAAADDILPKLFSELPVQVVGQITELEFEKDDDTNFHIDWITACSNLRATNYGIEPAGRNQTKVIAGNIIPAIATTTAMIAGFVCLELCKVAQNKPIEAFKSRYLNLATNQHSAFEPLECKKQEVGEKPYEFTFWDCLEVSGSDITLQELFDELEEQTGLEIENVTLMPSKLIFDVFLTKKKHGKEECNRRLSMPVSQLVAEITDEPLDGDSLMFSVDYCDDDFEEVDDDNYEKVELPNMRYTYK